MNKLKVSLTLVCLIPAIANANPMPKGASPLSGDEITSLYSGNTAVFSSTASAYFAPDKRIKGVNGGNPFEGTWSIKDNEICMANHGIDKKTGKWSDQFASDCWKLVKAGTTIWTLYTKAWDGKKVDLVNGWYKDHSLKAGDLVSAKYKAAGGL